MSNLQSREGNNTKHTEINIEDQQSRMNELKHLTNKI